MSILLGLKKKKIHTQNYIFTVGKHSIESNGFQGAIQNTNAQGLKSNSIFFLFIFYKFYMI